MEIKYVAVGRCPKCGKEFVRNKLCSHAACDCKNPTVLIPLHPAMICPDCGMLLQKRVVGKKNIVRYECPNESCSVIFVEKRQDGIVRIIRDPTMIPHPTIKFV